MGNGVVGRSRLVRFAAVTTIAVALVAGCTSDPPQPSTLTPTPSTTTVQTTVTSATVSPSSTTLSTSPAPTPTPSSVTTRPTSRPPTSSKPPTKTSKSDPPPPPADERFVVTIPASIKGADRKTAENAVDIYRQVQDIYDLSFRASRARKTGTRDEQYLSGV